MHRFAHLFMRSKISLLFFSTSCCVLIAGFFSGTSIPKAIEVNGLTMGTTYHVNYFDERGRDFKTSIDSLLVLVNKGISVFDPESEVSKFNRNTDGLKLTNKFFSETLSRAYQIALLSEGTFDPTVMPLVNAWGFGTQKNSSSTSAYITPTSGEIAHLKEIVGIDKIVLTSEEVQKKRPQVQLDFGGIGQGYGVDVVSDFLKSKGIKNFLVEIGGEGYAFGKNVTKDRDWVIGILNPNSTEEDQFMNAYVSLKNQSFTTTGNYFKNRKVNGKTYGHTIDPKTGYPVENEMLSVSVFSADCTTADAWDNALMVMGIEKSILMLKANPGLEAILQYSTPNGLQMYITPGLKDQIDLNN
jgi:FAD:protein FMN transferase